MGATPKPDEHRQRVKVAVLFTADQHDRVRARARAKGLPVAGYLRMLALDDGKGGKADGE